MPASSNIPSKIADYHVLPLSLPPLPAYPVSATHYLYLKPHVPNTPTRESARSLFLVNIPVDSTETHLKHLFSTQINQPAGHIKAVHFESSSSPGALANLPAPTPSTSTAIASTGPATAKSKKRKRGRDEEEAIPSLDGFGELPSTWDRRIHRSGSTAIVEFVDRASMEVALKAVKSAIAKSREIVWGEAVEGKVPPLGAEYYAKHLELTYPPKSELLSSVNAYMDAFNARQDALAAATKRKRQEPDEDGFVTVTRGASGGRSGAKMEAAKAALEKQKARDKKRGYGDFYRFQGREMRKERAKELVKKFEEGRERVRRLTERRTVRPEE